MCFHARFQRGQVDQPVNADENAEAGQGEPARKFCVDVGGGCDQHEREDALAVDFVTSSPTA